MATAYDGFESYVSSAPSPTSPYGRFITGNAADDGDLDNASYLMALAMAAQDNCQWLGWRVGYLNVVEGSTGNPALTTTIINYNHWLFNGAAIQFAGALVSFTGSNVLLQAHTTLSTANTFTVAPGSNIVVQPGGAVQIDGTATHVSTLDITGDASTASALVRLTAGAQFTNDASSPIILSGYIKRTGANAPAIGRPEVAAIVVTGTQSPLVADTFVIGDTAATVTCTLLNGAAGDTYDVTFYAAAHDHLYNLKVTGGPGPFAAFGAGLGYGSVTCRWTGVRWIVLSQIGDGTSITMTYTNLI